MSTNHDGYGDASPRGGLADFIAANVRSACARRSVTQAQLVRLTGYSRSSINRKFKGEYPWDVAEIEMIGRVLGADLSELIEGRVLRPTPPKSGGGMFAGKGSRNAALRLVALATSASSGPPGAAVAA